ncbi:putative nicotinate phosphoribosyltransferase [Bernardetia litoralis DSM 6794]|uniref:Nicotinate phosphoribosyltransferase n=1 Tax=Bernardetia litoralis (strain ATCC 23117 / DSM 6794 / NBRC 15988 / NCIMB 1366 / Fx l1 / Sio-4) TaxID=880071 RepID=I4AKE9_BERLS|nr:nicotinate phosphoribosyltransferase [Bernardetia litoralis]AFM04434.1 putative nicotinate phosphoribosyltransferase [Bernardetia litoralis DSM 6794]
MKITRNLYSSNLTLLTDLYQLTMAYGYWKAGMTDREAVFNLFFRRNPFKGGYAIACGLSYVIDFLENFNISDEDVAYLSTLKGNDDKQLFEPKFLDYLQQLEFTCDVDAVEEGSVVFPQEPLIRIKGSLIQCQILETLLLNMVNFQSLIATKSSRICLAARGEEVLEFGLRRAQGIDGGLAASRAAYIGGCAATSNVLAGKLFDIPVKGTHAHSWVMSFESEIEAFETYAEALPNNCIFLVDTYDTIEGVKHAIKAGNRLKEKGYKFAGIRLDSGDLAYLSTKARELLDAAGFTETVIVASNDLDEHIIDSLKQQDAKINVWGVGTKMVTAYDQPALGGVYKLSALRNKENTAWDYKVKLSEQAIKISTPGIQQIRRFYANGECIGDAIYDEENLPKNDNWTIIDPMDMTRRKKMTIVEGEYKDLLKPIFVNGKRVYKKPDLQTIQAKVKDELKTLHRSIKRFTNPHSYPVGLEKGLYDLKTDLILKLREVE